MGDFEPDPVSETAHSPRIGRCRISSRWLCAVALVVLGACGAVIVAVPSRPESLQSLPNWDLARLLPGIHEFPQDWNYSLRGPMRRTTPQNAAAAPTAGTSAPALTYTPGECAQVPEIVQLFGSSSYAAMVHVDRQTDEIARAVLISSDEPEPNAHYAIWPVPDGPALIAKYVDWLARCGSYRVTSTDSGGHQGLRAVRTTIDSQADGNSALAVTRSTTVTAPGPSRPLIYHVTYSWVRGVLLECATNLVGTDADSVNHVLAQTLQRMRSR